MYHVSAQGVDERMINVHYYYYSYRLSQGEIYREIHVSAVVLSVRCATTTDPSVTSG